MDTENEVIGLDPLALRPIELHDNNDELSAKYELREQVDKETFIETAEVKVKIGRNKENKLAIVISQ